MKKIIREWWWVACCLGLILLVGLGIRMYRLTALPVFADEAIYVRWSQVMAAEPTLRFLPLSDGKQPLFMWALMFLVRRVADPLWMGRMVSVAAGMATIVGVFGLSLLLFKNKRAALVVSLIWAVSPFAVFFERMALVDAMLAMWGVWTLFLGVLMAKTRRLDVAMFAGFVLGCAGLTKSPAVFMAVLLPSVWILGEWKVKRNEQMKRVVWGVILMAAIYSTALVMYNIQRLGPNFHMLSARTQDYVFPVSHLWENPMDPFKFHLHRGLQWIWIMGPSMLYGLVAAGLALGGRQRWREKSVLGLWFLGPLAVQAMFAKTFTARYILYTLPPLYVLAGMSLGGKNKKLQIGLGILLVVFVLQAMQYDYRLRMNPERANLPRSERSGYLEEWTAGTGIKEAAEIIEKESKGGPVVVGTEGYFGTLPDGLQIYLEGVPGVTVIGVGLGIKEVPVQLVESKAAGNKTYLLANTSRLKFEQDPEELGLKLEAAWEKAARPDWTREYVVYGERDELQLWEVE